LSQGQRQYAISSLAHQITVSARAAYASEQQGQELAKKLRALNELQHSVTGQLAHLLAGDGRWYSDEDFVGIIFDNARIGGIEPELNWSLEFAFGHMQPPANNC
jgi:hypothetical protein